MGDGKGQRGQLQAGLWRVYHFIDMLILGRRIGLPTKMKKRV